MNNTKQLEQQLNHWGASRTPFLMFIDFEMQEFFAQALDQISNHEVRYNFNGINNTDKTTSATPPSHLEWQTQFIEQATYLHAFNIVQQGLHQGDSYLTNLTFPTPIHTNWDLTTIFQHTKANYKLWYKDRFVLFSPETFVKIKDNKIYSFPMKGTLSAHLPAQILLDDTKEQAEHATIVDLIRNDLSILAKNVRVDKYRYVEQIETLHGNLWQTSSQISGDLPNNYHQQLGHILLKLLPAGSISGAPKKATVNIIQAAEQQKRGFYTGVAVLWDGYQLDSCVMIRFIEKNKKGLQYWSGGGITAYSNALEEYKELKEKVYLPVDLTLNTKSASDLASAE